MASTVQCHRGMPDYPLDAFQVPSILYFASGSNRVPVLDGFGRAGLPIGVAAPEVLARRGGFRPGVLEAIQRHPERPVFVDSGAFSEVCFKSGAPRVVRPMGAEQWRRVFELYFEIVRASRRGRVSIVAPDRVGDQAVTLERLARHAGELLELHELGAVVLLPVQRGELSAADFYRRACDVVGFEMVPAIPMKKKATSTADAARFLEAVKPARVHLLGKGPRSRDWRKLLEALRAASPTTTQTACLRPLLQRRKTPRSPRPIPTP